MPEKYIIYISAPLKKKESIFNDSNTTEAGEDEHTIDKFNNIPYPILLNYWKKRISTVLQIGNVSIQFFSYFSSLSSSL